MRKTWLRRALELIKPSLKRCSEDTHLRSKQEIVNYTVGNVMRAEGFEYQRNVDQLIRSGSNVRSIRVRVVDVCERVVENTILSAARHMSANSRSRSPFPGTNAGVPGSRCAVSQTAWVMFPRL